MENFKEFYNEIKVDFYEVKSGWINFTITVDDFVYDECFSYVFDPVLDLRNWLEAVCTNVQQTSFTFFEETRYIKFEIYTSDIGLSVLKICEDFEGGKILIDVQVERMQVVKAFYESFMKMIQSDNFDQKEWFKGIDLFEFKSVFIESFIEGS